ncbi:nucleoporin autopeptidase [Pseudozyma hubeiensis SY62]|uniref:Nucleoporin autopeptidase n=1 Tax=Pseudozyma hubeiensis (strain SY62) TaxID=1305764 RepID=R9PDE4_PSEHS|nr:nucleoporin autopeptidase [Pseudozyma hubeiensis SY62]GAC99384.1 nucleoporin autopeptidase [Pseudozyma hubeiensis SY62]
MQSTKTRKLALVRPADQSRKHRDEGQLDRAARHAIREEPAVLTLSINPASRVSPKLISSHINMVTRIPNEAGPSQVSFHCFELSPRRSLNPACRDVQATLSSFRFSASTVESPASGAAAPLDLLGPSEEDEYVEPLCMSNASSRRPSVQRTSSAPEASSSKTSLFVEPLAGPSVPRPLVARTCSESRASGVLERRRRKRNFRTTALPSTLMLDLAGLPMTLGAGNIGLLQAARRAIAEPTGFDWGGRAAISAPASSTKSRFSTQQAQNSSSCSPVRASKHTTNVSLPVSTSVSTSTSPESSQPAGGIVSSRSCTESHWSKCDTASEESEWDWALAGTARATHEVLRYSAYKEKREPVHDIWNQLPDWMSRRSSHGGRDADMSLRGPGLFSAFGMSKSTPEVSEAAAAAVAAATPAALAAAIAEAKLSNLSPRNSISGRGRAAKMSVHVPYRVIEELPPRDSSVSPRASVAELGQLCYGVERNLPGLS